MNRFRKKRSGIYRASTFTPPVASTTNNHEAPTTVDMSWWSRNAVIIQWLMLAGALFTGVVNFYYLSRSEARQNRSADQLFEQGETIQKLTKQQIDEAAANTNSLVKNMDSIPAQIALADATVKDLNDPIKRTAGTLQLEKLRAERAISIDEILESALPNVQVVPIDKTMNIWTDSLAIAHFKLVNNGKRKVRFLFRPSFPQSVREKDKFGQTLNFQDYSLDGSSQERINWILPGQSTYVQVAIQSKSTLSGTISIPIIAHFQFITELPEQSESYKVLSNVYPKNYIDSRLGFEYTFDTNIIR